ncbi:MAG TPA: hypothetical protein PLV58_07870 [Campylobacterales bacterium]|nr:hypothetical protein [Campylobacterales bacterium]
MNLGAPIPFGVIAIGVVVLAAIFLIGLLIVKNHPKAKEESRR